MFEWMTNVVQSLGALGVAFLMFLENIFPPIPSELVMPLAGFVAARGEMSFWPMVLAGAAGSLAGATLWYFIGRKIGERRLRRWVDDHGRWLTLSCDDMDRAQDWFERRGRSAVFVGRLIPGVRTFISLPAGFSGMPMASFVGYSALGTLIWTAALAFAGRLLGSQYERVGSSGARLLARDRKHRAPVHRSADTPKPDSWRGVEEGCELAHPAFPCLVRAMHRRRPVA